MIGNTDIIAPRFLIVPVISGANAPLNTAPLGSFGLSGAKLVVRVSLNKWETVTST